MEKMMPEVVRVQEHSGEVSKGDLARVVDMIERELQMHIESATPDKKIDVITNILTQLNSTDDDVPLLESMRQMAALEKDFKVACDRLSELTAA